MAQIRQCHITGKSTRRCCNSHKLTTHTVITSSRVAIYKLPSESVLISHHGELRMLVYEDLQARKHNSLPNIFAVTTRPKKSKYDHHCYKK